MRTLNMLLGGLLAAAIALTPASAASTDPDTLIDPGVRAGTYKGMKSVCDVGLTLGRATGERALLSLSYLQITPRLASMMLKISYNAPGSDAGILPTAAFLFTSSGDNRAEVIAAQASDSPGFLITVFRDGPLTREVFGALRATGRFDIGLVLPDGTTQRWSADLGPRKDLRDAWAKCMRELVPSRPE